MCFQRVDKAEIAGLHTPAHCLPAGHPGGRHTAILTINDISLSCILLTIDTGRVLHGPWGSARHRRCVGECVVKHAICTHVACFQSFLTARHRYLMASSA